MMKFQSGFLVSLLIVFIFLPTITQAQISSYGTQVSYLSGTDKDHRVQWDFKIDKGRNSGKWSKIPVPSNWETEGFGVYNYGHDWRDSLPQSDDTGYYKHMFSVANEWKDKKIEIVFEAVMTDAEVKINGKLAGAVHQGGFYEFKYDITHLIKFGEKNLLEVTVKNVSANNSVNRAERDADFWVFGGIYRPVYLQAKPTENIDRFAIDAKDDGSFAADVYLNGVVEANNVEAQIFTMNDQPVGVPFRVNIQRGSEKVSLKTSVKDPKLWSAEFPNRYKVELRLKKGNTIVHTVNERFGFRTIELRPKDGFYVNGQKVKFKGVNRHSAWPTTGRTTSYGLSVFDVNLMKDMNMNAVRMSHYPPDKHFLYVCDSLGLYVIDELTGWQKAYDTTVGRKLVKELVIRDVNHPSIILWANGNEGGNNYSLLPDYPIYDPQKRVVIHPWNTLGETNTFHYPDLDYVADVLSKKDKIYFPTEFMHGLYDGGHGAGLDEFWNLMQNSELSAGGFLWSFADEGVVRDDQNGKIDVKKTAAPDGILGPYREKEGSYYTIKEIWSPIYISQQYITPTFSGKLKLENRYSFTNLAQCTFQWRLVKFQIPATVQTDSLIMSKGKAIAPSIAPGLSGYLNLNLPKNWLEADALYLEATDPQGRNLYTWSWPISTASQIAARIIPRPSSQQAALAIEADTSISISANGVVVSFSKKDGTITGVKNSKTTVSFNGGPKLLSGEAKFVSISHWQEDNNQVVEVKYNGAISEMRYTMLASGWLKLDYSYNLMGDFDYAGISFNYPESKVKGIRWLGNGPFRVWKNRMKGTQFAVHQKKYNNTVTGKDWNYPEFKGYHDRMYWAVLETDETPITIVSETDHVFLRLFTPTPTGFSRVDPVFPEGDISFMDGITPIGTKFQSATQLGPQGNKNQFRFRKDRQRLLGATLYFDFGVNTSYK